MDSFINYPNLDPLLTSDPEYEEITKQILVEYPRACICMIDRVRSPLHISEAFEKKRLELEQKENGLGAVKRVYHGTQPKHVLSILTHGFQPQFARIQAYGAGIYFATRFAISWTYAPTDTKANDLLSHIFICDILPGRLCLGTNNSNPPAGFDSQGNGPCAQDATYFAIPAANQMIPRFLVRFHKDSERIAEADGAAGPPPPAHLPPSVRAQLKRMKKSKA